MKTHIFRGFIREVDYGENFSTIKLDGSDEPLAKEIEYILSKERVVTVRYFISDKEKLIDELNENLIKTISGAISAEYSDNYSEYTGYLWTDEELNVGGHDLLQELENNKDKFLYLEIIL